MPVHAFRFSGIGVLLMSPCCKLVGTEAVPLTNSWNASSDVTFAPAGAPALVSTSGRPLPAHRTESSA